MLQGGFEVEAVDWLLEEDAPGVELVARTRLLGESPSSRRVEKLARHVLGKQLENGGFSPSGKPSFEIACLTPNTLRALTVLQQFGRLRG